MLVQEMLDAFENDDSFSENVLLEKLSEERIISLWSSCGFQMSHFFALLPLFNEVFCSVGFIVREIAIFPLETGLAAFEFSAKDGEGWFV